MTDSSGTPMFPARDARLTPEVVAERAFTQVKRGYAESEVRAFLRMVSDDLTTMRSRERELTARMHDLEDRLARPAQVPSDQDLIAALGEETARVLTQAREAAADLRNKADEHARRVVREAQESARELRASTQQAVEAKTREAEDAARARAREILGEARALRDRVLTDLNERRTDLERQIGELRASRGKLVEVYELVERALVQATRTIAEEPAMPAPSVAPTSDVDAPEPEHASPDVGAPAAAGDGDRDADARTEARSTSGGSGAAPTSPSQSADDGPDVGALFEKLRSSGSTADETPDSPVVEAATPDDETALFPESDVAVEAEVVDEPGDADQAAIAARDDTLAPIADDLAHRAKRAVQDEQNDVLDGLRRQRGKIDVAKVLPVSRRPAHPVGPRPPAVRRPGVRGRRGVDGVCLGRWRDRRGARCTAHRARDRRGHAPPHPTRRVARVDRRQVAGRRRDRDRPAPRRSVPRVAGPRPRRRSSATRSPRPLPVARTTQHLKVRGCAGCPRGWGSAPTATTTRSSRRFGVTTSRPGSRTHPRIRGVAASWCSQTGPGA